MSTPMKRYRYLSLKKFLKHCEDTYSKDKIFMASWQSLNDKLEGHFQYYLDEEAEAIETVFEKQNYRVACFTKKYTNQMLWAHYGDEGKGICLGYEFTGKELKEHNLKYRDIRYPKEMVFQETQDPAEDRAFHILSTKLNCWAKEEETRIFAENATEFVDFPFLKEIILGPQFEKDKKDKFLFEIYRCFAGKEIRISELIPCSGFPYLKKEIIKSF